MAIKWIQLDTKEVKFIIQSIVQNYTSDIEEKDYKKLKNKLEKIQKRIKISSGKQKGRGLQYWVCERISEITGFKFEQSNDQCLIHSREMGQHGKDIILRGDALKQFPYSIECKSSEGMDLVKTIEQVKSNMDSDTDWLIVHKRKAIPSPIVIMDWYHFEQLIRDKNEKE